MVFDRISGAYCYYLFSSLRNRLLQARGRLKSPRYLLGFVLAGGYFVWLGARSGFSTPVFMISFYSALFLITWLALPFRSGTAGGRVLSFTQSDVQQLFPAPLSRRRLLQFKLMQNQGASIVFALIFSLLSRNIEGASFVYLFFGLFILSNVLNMHGSLLTAAANGLRKSGNAYALWVVPGAVLTAAGVAMWFAQQQLTDLGLSISEISQTPAIHWLAMPVNVMFRPALAGTSLEFVQSVWIPLALWAGHALVFFNIRFSFEDDAITTAERISEIRTQGVAALRKKNLVVRKSNSPLQRLAPTGAQWRAVAWKNILSIVRISPGSGKRIALFVILVLLVGRFVPDPLLGAAVTVLLGMVGMSILLGPAFLRVDLRIDIPHFDVLKSLPIRGRQLVFGEVMGSQCVLFTFQVVMFAVALYLMRSVDDANLPDLGILWLAVLPVLFALDFFFLTFQNLKALYLPSFSTLGPGMNSGNYQFGRNTLNLLIHLILLALASIVPAIVAAIGFFASSVAFDVESGIPVVFAVALASIAFFVEALVPIYLAETRYERFDISEENVVADAN